MTQNVCGNVWKWYISSIPQKGYSTQKGVSGRASGKEIKAMFPKLKQRKGKQNILPSKC